MSSKENHLKKIEEHLEEIRDALDEGLEKKPITIGFHCSACSVELLELFLHQSNKITIGKVLEHNWFKRPNAGQKKDALADRKLGIDFPDKDQIFELIYTIEEKRNNLIYGSPIKEDIEAVLQAFNQLKDILRKKLQMEGITFGK